MEDDDEIDRDDMERRSFQAKDIPTMDVLEACRDSHAGGVALSAFDILANRKLGVPAKVLIAALEREFRKGRIEYGVSLATAWVTPEGKLYMKAEEESIVNLRTITVGSFRDAISEVQAAAQMLVKGTADGKDYIMGVAGAEVRTDPQTGDEVLLIEVTAPDPDAKPEGTIHLPSKH